MSGFTPGVNVAQVVMQYLFDNQPVENVWWFEGTAAWGESNLALLAQAMNSWEVAHALALRTTNVAFERVVATDWSTQFGVQAINNTGLPLDGDQTPALPNHVTVAIKHGTGLRGRNFRGRHYWIGIGEALTSDNTVTNAFITAAMSAYGAIAAAVSGINGAQHIVFSQFTLISGVSTRRTLGVSTPVKFYSIDQFIDSQRRRLPGHNRHR